LADSDAVRSQRKRRHAAGDHSLCHPARCAEADGDRVRAELEARVAELAEIDPAAELLALVRRLIAASEQNPLNMGVVKELRATLLALPAGGELDPVERRQAEVAARQAAWRAGVADVVPLPAYRRGGGVTYEGAEYWEVGADPRRSDG
jgi:hypothetical protein